VREANPGLSTEAGRRMREMGESMAIDSAPETRPDISLELFRHQPPGCARLPRPEMRRDYKFSIASASALFRLLSSPFISMAPWLPRLGGKVLGACPLLDELRDQVPDPRNPSERPWSREVVVGGLAVCEEDREALWEAVLALWHLKMCEENGAEDPSWLALMRAWLVSATSLPGACCRADSFSLQGCFFSLCDALQIEAGEPVTSYREFLIASQVFAEDQLPGATVEPPSTTQGSSQGSRLAKKKANPREDGKQDSKTDDEDTVVVTSSWLRPQSKKKGKVPVKTPIPFSSEKAKSSAKATKNKEKAVAAKGN